MTAPIRQGEKIMKSSFLIAALASVLAAGCGGEDTAPPTGQPLMPQQLPPPTAALGITSAAPPTGYSGYAYDGRSNGFSLTASGGVAPYKWRWAAAASSSLPPGLSIVTNADNTGAISGIPTANGSYNVAVAVSDSESPVSTVSNTYTITISAQAASGLAITSGSPPSGQAGTLYDNHGLTCTRGFYCVDLNGFVLSGSGGMAPYRWSWGAGAGSSLPPGLNVAFGPIGITYTGQVVYGRRIAGTPTAVGKYNVVVTLTDSESPPMKVSANYTIVTTPPPPPVISTSPPATGALHLPYEFTFSVERGGLAPFKWSEVGAPPPGLSLSTGGVLSGAPTATGSFPITVQVQDSLRQESAPQKLLVQIYLHGFEATGSMETPRINHSATLLSNGMVLVTGGNSIVGADTNATAELYDPNSGAFAPTGSMQTARSNHTATLLSPLPTTGGKVLVTGGSTAKTAELFDPSSGTFKPTGSMETARFYHTATLLKNGTVLVAGGADFATIYASSELFEPSSGTFTPTGSMMTARYGHNATLLGNGMVLVAGGIPINGATESAELYDPAHGTFTPTGSMTGARFAHTATLLPSGKVLVTGGLDGNGIPTATAELFDPSTGKFTATGSMKTTRAYHSATKLNDGTVLVTGGDTDLDYLATAEVFDPSSGTFSATDSMETPRLGHTSTLLRNGAVLVTGGSANSIGEPALSSAELYR